MKDTRRLNHFTKINKAACYLFFLLLTVSCSKQSPVDAIIEEAANMEHCLIPYDSVGVRVGDVRLMFGSVLGADFTADGILAILDDTFEGVRYYTPNGTHIETFAPIGEGAGELKVVDKIAFDQEGNLYLGDYYERKICVYNSNFDFLRELEFTGSDRTGPFQVYPGPDSTLILKTGYFTEDSLGTEVARFSTSEAPDLIYRRRMVSVEEGSNFLHLTAMAMTVDPAGRVYIADNVYDQFKIICYSPEGDSLFSFGFEEYAPIAVSFSSQDLLRQRYLEDYIAHHGTSEGFDYETPEFHRPILSIAVDSQNRIWVREEFNSRISYIFDDEGTYLYTMGTDFPSWQRTRGWNLRVSPRGIFADPRNPEFYSLVYLMRERPLSSSDDTSKAR